MIFFVYKYNKHNSSENELIAEWQNIRAQTFMKKVEELMLTLQTSEGLYITMWDEKANKMLRLYIK